MFKNDLQIEVCKALLKESRVSGGYINENEFAVTIDGFKLFVFNTKEIIFDINKIPPFNAAEILKETENDIAIIPTSNYKSSRGILCREYIADGTNLAVYLDLKQIKLFEGCTFYANSPQNRVIAKDVFERTIGVVMPVRMN